MKLMMQKLLDHNKKYVEESHKNETTTSAPARETCATLSPKRLGLARLIFTTVVATCANLSNGSAGSFPSPAIPNLNSRPNPFHVTDAEQSWHAGIYHAGAVIGALISTTLVDHLGRKCTLAVAPIFVVVGWIFVVASTDAIMLIGARALIGITNPVMSVSMNAYLAEISPPSLRGLVSSTSRTMFNLGVLVTLFGGVYLPWNWLAIICILPSVLLAILIHLVPESPYWLLQQNRIVEATEVQLWLNGTSSTKMHQHQEGDLKLAKLNDSCSGPAPWLSFFKMPLLKCLLISQSLCLVCAFSGTTLLRSYAVTILQWSESSFDPYTQTVLLGVVSLGGSLISSAIFDRFPRRLMLMSSYVIASVGWVTMGAYFVALTEYRYFVSDHLQWIPMLSLLMVCFGNSLCSTTATFLVTNEIFPTNARGRACCLIEVNYHGCSFFVTKTFLQLRNCLGNFGVFWLLGFFSVSGAIFIYFCVPETNGKNLTELDQELNKLQASNKNKIAATT